MTACNCRVSDAVAAVTSTAEREAWMYSNAELRGIIGDLWVAYRAGIAPDAQRARALLLVLTMEVERMEGGWAS